uniref:Uncharacterized protein n=1 Tax=Amphimedon queenslandica TaxID=400682 RepID=A0A1X7V8K8_AMPQE
MRDSFGNIAALAWNQVKMEPNVKEPSSFNAALIADLAMRGVWSSQVDVLCDMSVTDTDAYSYGDQTPLSMLKRAEALCDMSVTDTDAYSYGDQTPLSMLKRAEAEIKDKISKGM